MSEKNFTNDLLEEIGGRICGGQNKKGFILLYKATSKPNVGEFHSKCDNKGPTLTLLYGASNTLFGGYTSQNWSSNDKRQKVRDEYAFLFTKNENDGARCIFLPIKNEKGKSAITCDAEFGPTFGGNALGNYDLQAFKYDTKPETENEDGSIDLNGTLNIGQAYSVKGNCGDMERAENVNKQKVKTRDINSGNMKVRRVEVYQVVDDESSEDWLVKLEDEEAVRKKVIEMSTIPGLDVKQYNILLVGVIGSGKSSFVNTMSTVFTRKCAQIAQARDSTTSVTNAVKAYVLKSQSGEQLPIRIFDIRGFDNERGYDHELELLLDGKLPVGYEFPENPGPVVGQIETKSTLNDKMHLVCLVNGNLQFEMNTPQLQQRFDDIKKTVAKKGLPLVVVATKFDQLCQKISKNIDHIYRSPKAKCAVNSISEFYGVPTRNVFPIVNYVSEEIPEKGIDKLALKALFEMKTKIEDHLEHHEEMVVKPDDWSEREKLLPTLTNAAHKEVYLVKIHEKSSKFENKKLRILVIGPVNSGKSSFIDSVSSTLRDQIEIKATANEAASSASAQQPRVSSTEKFQIYPLKCKHGEEESKINVSFGDTPGFQEEEGISVDHVKFILRGNVPNKYKIINGIRETARDFKSEPTPFDKIHCACIVFDCVTVRRGLSEKMINTMQNMQSALRAEGIQYKVILTKCDVVSKKLKVERRRVFEDKIVKECKNTLMDKFSLKQQLIFPVVNYTNENLVDLQADALLIAAFNKILCTGMDFLEGKEDEEDNYRF